jgi:osmotically-inducible protein OsmY
MRRFQPNQERDMNIPRERRNLHLCAYLAAAVCGMAGFATTVAAQNTVLPPASQSDSVAVAAMPGSSAPADEELKERVQAALHAAPYFYDQHVTVSVEKGVLVLRGFVFSDWDLQEAMRIADQAAGHRRVIDELSIKQGGRR